MTAPVQELAPAPALDDGGEDDDLVHTHCCEDLGVAMCGVELDEGEGATHPSDYDGDDLCLPCDVADDLRLDRGGCPGACPVSALRSLKGPNR